MTDDCNFNCPYCYQDKGNTYIDNSAIKKAIDFFFPFLKKRCYINFYGGEPLLALNQILFAIDYFQSMNKRERKNIIFSMTTNGSLISDEILDILSQNKFSLLLSFDGIVQEVSRKKGTFDKITAILKKTMRFPQIDLETNSVFTPTTIQNLSDSIISIVEMGVPNVSLALSQTAIWDFSSLSHFEKELDALAEYLLSFYKRKGHIPVVNFRKDYTKAVFACHAAKDRLAMTADGNLWGCHLFADVYGRKQDTEDYAKYCFGDLDSFIKNHEDTYAKISANYSGLRMDRFHTANERCIDCSELEDCRVCPMDNLMQGSEIEKVPGWACEQKKIMREVKKKLWKDCI
jgi:sulfatase maturation enzyme AslB (radical SAM superfamily)